MARDIRVRLTPEGVSDVIKALRQVQGEATRASKTAEGGVRGLRTAVVGLRGLIATLGIGAVFRQVVRETAQAEQQLAQLDAVLKSTGEAAGFNRDQLVTLAEDLSRTSTLSTGDIISAQTRLLSYVGIVGDQYPKALQIAIDQQARLGISAEQSAEIIGKALEKPSQGVVALTRQGFRFTESQRKLFKSLEESGRLAEAQNIVIDVLAESYGGAAAAARDTFGGALASVRNAINDLLTADGGLPEATASLNQLSETLKDPAVQQAADTLFSALIRGAAGAAQFFGDIIAGLTVLAGARTGNEIEDLTRQIEDLDAAIRRSEGWQNFFGIFGSNTDDLVRQREELLKLQRALLGFDETAGRIATNNARRTGPLNSRRNALPALAPTAVESPDLEAARRDAERQRTQQELALTQERIRQRQDAEERAFEAGLTSLDAYYAQRLALIREAGAAEEAALRRQIDLVRQAPTATPEEAAAQSAQIEKLRFDLSLKRLQTEGRLAAIAGERAAEERRLVTEVGEARFDLEQRLLEASGRGSQARLAALDQEITKLRETFRAAGELTDEIETKLASLREASAASIQVGDLGGQIETVFSEIERARLRIEQDVGLGITTQLEGQRQIAALEAARLPVLQAIVAQLQAAAAASGDPALVAQAEDLNLRVGALAVSVAKASDELAQFKEEANQAVQSNLRSFLEDGVREAKNLGEAFTNMADSIIADLVRIASRAVADQIFGGLFNIAGANSGNLLGKALGFLGFARGGLVRYSGGGIVRGPGTGTSDSIPGVTSTGRPILVSNGEFIVRAKAVQQPGVLELLRNINGLQLRPRATPNGFAEGGLVGVAAEGRGTAGGGGRPLIQNFNFAEPQSRQTQQQVAAAAFRGAARAERRNS